MGQSVEGNAERGNRYGLAAARIVRLRPADGQHGTGRERLPALKRSCLERGLEIRPRRDPYVERDAVRRLVCRAADQRRPVGEGEAAETSGDADERDDRGGHQGERARLTSARRGSTGPLRATRSAPCSTSPAARNVSTPTATQQSGASSSVIA